MKNRYRATEPAVSDGLPSIICMLPAPICARCTSWEKSLLCKTGEAGCPGNQRVGSSPTQHVGVQGVPRPVLRPVSPASLWGDQAYPRHGVGAAVPSPGVPPAPQPFIGVERAWLQLGVGVDVFIYLIIYFQAKPS